MAGKPPTGNDPPGNGDTQRTSVWSEPAVIAALITAVIGALAAIGVAMLSPSDRDETMDGPRVSSNSLTSLPTGSATSSSLRPGVSTPPLASASTTGPRSQGSETRSARAGQAVSFFDGAISVTIIATSRSGFVSLRAVSGPVQCAVTMRFNQALVVHANDIYYKAAHVGVSPGAVNLETGVIQGVEVQVIRQTEPVPVGDDGCGLSDR
jgi:hypothetical protein